MKNDEWTEDPANPQYFQFEDDRINLEITGNPPIIVDGWEIIPHCTPLEEAIIYLVIAANSN